MKAWFVWIDNEWGDYVHGETVSKAKTMFWNEWSIEVDEWIRMRPVRAKEFDNIPITPNIVKEITGYDFEYICCKCDLCNPSPSQGESGQDTYTTGV